MSDWFDKWLDSDDSDESDPDCFQRPISIAEFALMLFIGGLVAVMLVVCAIAVLVLVFGGLTLLWEEFAITKWLLAIGVFAGFMYWDKKVSGRK